MDGFVHLCYCSQMDGLFCVWITSHAIVDMLSDWLVYDLFSWQVTDDAAAKFTEVSAHELVSIDRLMEVKLTTAETERNKEHCSTITQNLTSHKKRYFLTPNYPSLQTHDVFFFAIYAHKLHLYRHSDIKLATATVWIHKLFHYTPSYHAQVTYRDLHLQ